MTDFGQCCIMKQTEEHIVFQIDDDDFWKNQIMMRAAQNRVHSLNSRVCIQILDSDCWLRARQGREFEIAVKRCEF